MTSIKEPKLGLPPMELAENVSQNSSEGKFSCLKLAILKGVLHMIFILSVAVPLIIVAILFLPMTGLLEKKTEVISYTGAREIPNFTINQADVDILLNLKNHNPSVNVKRKKRDLRTNKKKIDVNLLETNFKDHDFEKARDVIFEYRKPCEPGNEEAICKDIVQKLNTIKKNKTNLHINSNSKGHGDIQNRENRQTISDKDQDSISSSTSSDIKLNTNIINNGKDTTENVGNGGRAANDGILDLNENLQSVGSPYNIPYPPIADTCLLSRLLRNHHPQGHVNLESLYNTPYLSPPYLPPLPLPYQLPNVNLPWLHTRDTEMEERKPHPQDIGIFLHYKSSEAPPSTRMSYNASSRDIQCEFGTAPCDDGEHCVKLDKWCDRFVDCPDSSDEARCTCKSKVDYTRLCDGYYDCPFGEDEMGCHGCGEDEFSCENLDLNSRGTCFRKEQRCNNIIECPNNKDELECNMLAPSLHEKPMFAVSHTEGYLQRNFKGSWYAVCKNPYMWAHDACLRETGLILSPPYLQMVSIDPLLKISYLNNGPGGLLDKSDTCYNSSSVYVTCPGLLCGTRVLTTSQMLQKSAQIENRMFGRNKRYLCQNNPSLCSGNRRRRYANMNNEINQSTEKSLTESRHKRTKSRVVGGKPSQPAAWPWMVALYRDGSFHCGGVILNHRWVISAAHCVSKFWEHYYEIQVGMLRRFSFSPQEQNHKVTHVIVNQYYDQNDMKNDLSLLRVKPAIQFSRWVRPICLPGPDVAGPDWKSGPPAGTMCTAVGWGATVEEGPDPDHMREVDVPIWNKCKHREDRAGKEICAGLVEGGRDACQGDSGGPLLCRNPLNPQQWYMAGIVSHGEGCARKDEPGVYTRVSLYINWIQYHINSKILPTIRPKQECPGFKCVSGVTKCLSKKRICDKVIDCLDGEDEISCKYMRSSQDQGEGEDFLLTERDNVNTNEVPVIIRNAFDNDRQLRMDNKPPVPNFTKWSTERNSKMTNRDESNESDFKPHKNSSIEESSNSKSESDETTNDSDIVHEQNDFTTQIISTESVTKSIISNENFNNDTNDILVEQDTTTNEATISTRGETTTTTIFSNTDHSNELFKSTPSFKQHKEDATNKENISTDQSAIIKTNVPTQTTPIRGDGISIENSVTDNGNNIKNNDMIKSDVTEKDKLEESKSPVSEKSPTIVPSSHSINDVETKINSSDMEKKNFEIDLSEEVEKKLPKLDELKSLLNIIKKGEPKLHHILQPAQIRKTQHIPKHFECKRIPQIIPSDHRCDHKADCEDGTDEYGCSCVDYVTTFDSSLLCDGQIDCADGQDELNCYGCSEDQFLCKWTQTCLPIKYVCDGVPQCPQGEDELDCYALSNGKNIICDFDGRPKTNLEGFLTRKHQNKWNIVCEDNLSLGQQEESASHICRYLGFSSANRFHVKYVNIRENDIRGVIKSIHKRGASEIPIQFTYTQRNSAKSSGKHIVIDKPEIIKETCVPNITKTCMTLYVYCAQTLYTDFSSYDIGEYNEIIAPGGRSEENILPWIAKVYVEGEYRCTGILIDLSWILISQSCLWDTLLIRHYVSVALGSHRTLASTTGPYEQIYQVDFMKNMYLGKVILLHLVEPAHYSALVKPMVSSSFNVQNIKNHDMCLAVGQDLSNNTVSIFLNETFKGKAHERKFTRLYKNPVCDQALNLKRPWSGIVSCHSDQGWYPAASFYEAKGECEFDTILSAHDIEQFTLDIKHYIGHYKDNSTNNTSVEQSIGDNCDGQRCSRGRCIRFKKLCDGVRDCEDGNDESETACDAKQRICNEDPYHKGCECTSGQLKCRNGRCVSKEMFGDGHDQCGDGSDEPKQTTCAQYLARVAPTRLCDGFLHCADRTDEDPTFCKCFAKISYRCGGSETCVAPDMICDGVPDCPNGEDELTCLALRSPTGTAYGTGEVIMRSHGEWQTKCYPVVNHTRSKLEEICNDLGFQSGHAKQLKSPEYHPHPITKVALDTFTQIVLNNNTVITLRNTDRPLAKVIVDHDAENCHPVFIECL